MKAPKARDWLQADKEHPLLVRNRKENIQSLEPYQETVRKEIKREKEKEKHVERVAPSESLQKEVPIAVVKPKLDLNHPAFQPHKQIVDKEEDENESVVLSLPKLDFSHTDNLDSHKAENVYERCELSNVFKHWLQNAENPDKVPWDESDAPENFFVWTRSNRVDPFHGFDWTRSQVGRLFKVQGGKDNRGKIHGKAEITFQNGETVVGCYSHGKRSGYCEIKSPAKGIAKLSGYWVNDKLEGFSLCNFLDGSSEQGWVRDGVWHGAFRYS